MNLLPTIRLLSLCMALSAPLLVVAKDPPPPPQPPRLVNDFTGTLTPEERAALERKLTAYDDSTSTQIAIVLEKTLEGDDPFDYSYRLAEAWGIGRQGKNNGILIYIALADRELRIQTGYGAEGFLPDAMAKRIISQIIAPRFREGNYYAGLDEATDFIIALGNGEYVNEDPGRKGKLDFLPRLVFLLIFVIAIILYIVRKTGGGGGGGGYYRGGRYDRRGGGWSWYGGGHHWGGGGFGGGGGGGFGGFGGGSFGGGGAGGSW